MSPPPDPLAVARRQSWLRISLAVAGLWFLLLYPLLTLLCPTFLREKMVPNQTKLPVDIGQYYAGGLAARHGLWSSLYPVPREEVFRDPPRFRPVFPIPGLSGAEENGEIATLPRLARPDVSDFSPELLALEPRLRKAWARYIYPPPLAWALAPLTFLDLHTLAYRVFPVAISLVLFAIACLSVRIYRHLAGKPSFAEPTLVLLTVFFSFGSKSGVYETNATLLIALGLALAAYAWLRGREVVVGLCMIALVLLKAVTLNWCPLLLLPKIRWKTVATLAVATLMLNGMTLAAGGWEVYRQFFSEVVPSMNTPAGFGVPAFLFHFYGIFPKTVYLAVSSLLALWLYIAYYRNPVAPEAKARGPEIIAALAGTTALFCLFNPTIWQSYFVNYCCLPFAGWMLWELGQSKGLFRVALLTLAPGVGALAYGDWLIEAILMRFSPYVAIVFQMGVSQFVETVVGPLLFYTVALHRLHARPQVPPTGWRAEPHSVESGSA